VRGWEKPGRRETGLFLCEHELNHESNHVHGSRIVC
jgi:hypothetical protein